jgi:hypothetical protein
VQAFDFYGSPWLSIKKNEEEQRRERDAEFAATREQERQVKAKAVSDLDQFVLNSIKDGSDLAFLESEVNNAHSAGVIDQKARTEILVSAFERCVDAFLEDGLLDEDEENKLVQFQNAFSLTQSQLDRRGKFLKVGKSSVLRKVMNGEFPSNVQVDLNNVVNFQKGENPIWVFNGCQYLEDVVRRQFVGGSQGLSFRVMKGVYYRVGAFKGESVSTVERKNLGTGSLVVTNKNLYFIGPGKTSKIPFSKIVSFTPYSDAVGIMRDAATAKPQFFMVDDAWFAFNLISNAAKVY